MARVGHLGAEKSPLLSRVVLSAEIDPRPARVLCCFSTTYVQLPGELTPYSLLVGNQSLSPSLSTPSHPIPAYLPNATTNPCLGVGPGVMSCQGLNSWPSWSAV